MPESGPTSAEEGDALGSAMMAATHEPGTETDVGPTVVSDRLTLRLLAPADVPAVLAYQVANAAHLAPTSPLPPPGYLTEAFWRERVERDRADAADGRAVRFFLFPNGEPGRVVGNLAVNNITRGAAFFCDLGYALAANRQGQGLMGEAVAAAVRYAFADLGLRRVKAAYLPGNKRSGRLLRRLGFAVEGYARDYLLIEGRWQEHVLVGKTNPDWFPPT